MRFSSDSFRQVIAKLSDTERRWMLVSASCLLLTLSAGMLLHHADAIRDARDEALPLASQLPPLERHLSVLKQEVEMAEITSQLRSGSQVERLHMYVLPREPDTVRFLAFLDVLQDALQKRKMLRSMTPIVMSDAQQTQFAGQELVGRTATFSAIVNQEGMNTLLSLERLTGLLTVADTLSTDQKKQLFDLIDQRNPAYIIPVEQILNADLMTYARDPRSYDDRLTKAVPEEALSVLQKALSSPLLSEAKHLLGGEMGSLLLAQKLWPLPFSTVDTMEIEPLPEGLMRLELSLWIYGTGGERD